MHSYPSVMQTRPPPPALHWLQLQRSVVLCISFCLQLCRYSQMSSILRVSLRDGSWACMRRAPSGTTLRTAWRTRPTSRSWRPRRPPTRCSSSRRRPAASAPRHVTPAVTHSPFWSSQLNCHALHVACMQVRCVRMHACVQVGIVRMTACMRVRLFTV
jgi:hypothetical protein